MSFSRLRYGVPLFLFKVTEYYTLRFKRVGKRRLFQRMANKNNDRRKRISLENNQIYERIVLIDDYSKVKLMSHKSEPSCSKRIDGLAQRTQLWPVFQLKIEKSYQRLKLKTKQLFLGAAFSMVSSRSQNNNVLQEGYSRKIFNEAYQQFVKKTLQALSLRKILQL